MLLATDTCSPWLFETRIIGEYFTAICFIRVLRDFLLPVKLSHASKISIHRVFIFCGKLSLEQNYLKIKPKVYKELCNNRIIQNTSNLKASSQKGPHFLGQSEQTMPFKPLKIFCQSILLPKKNKYSIQNVSIDIRNYLNNHSVKK